MVKSCGVELYEFHILDSSFGAVYHGYAVAGGDKWIGCGLIYGSGSSGCHKGQF